MTTIWVSVTPKAKEKSIRQDGERLIIRVVEPAEGGQANRAVCDLAADFLGLPHSRVTVIRGAASRKKLLHIV